MVNLLDKKVNGRLLSTLIVFSFATLISLIDFTDIIEKCYPFLSVVGIILIVLGVAMLMLNSKIKTHKKTHFCHRSKIFSNSDSK